MILIHRHEMQEKLNKKTYENTKDPTFIISQTLIIKLYDTFNVCRL